MSQVKPNTLPEIAEVVRVLEAGGQVKVTPLSGYGQPGNAQEVYVDGGLTYLPDFSAYRYDPMPQEVEVVVLLSKRTGRIVSAVPSGTSHYEDNDAYRYVKGKLTYDA